MPALLVEQLRQTRIAACARGLGAAPGGAHCVIQPACRGICKGQRTQRLRRVIGQYGGALAKTNGFRRVAQTRLIGGRQDQRKTNECCRMIRLTRRTSRSSRAASAGRPSRMNRSARFTRART